MSTPTKTEFLLLFSEATSTPDLSSQEMQNVTEKWMAWLRGIQAKGDYVAGNRLEEGRKVIRAKFTDGPYVESKELVGGFIIIRAADMAHAEHVAKGCPGLSYGTNIEIRPVVPSEL